MSDQWSVLLTGPILDPQPWQQAALDAGWKSINHPLLKRAALPLGDTAIEVPDWIAVTSSGAVDALVRARDTGAVWCHSALAAVGLGTAAALEKRGFKVSATAPEGNASSLAKVLIQEATKGARILWLRGERARDLGDELREAQFTVDERIVYRTEPAISDPAPLTDVVFFAAPEAVELWCRQDHSFRPAALAIGWTTLDALLTNQNQFSLTLPLASPEPESLGLALGAIAANQ